jgi:hypothetical protein
MARSLAGVEGKPGVGLRQNRDNNGSRKIFQTGTHLLTGAYQQPIHYDVQSVNIQNLDCVVSRNTTVCLSMVQLPPSTLYADTKCVRLKNRSSKNVSADKLAVVNYLEVSS